MYLKSFFGEVGNPHPCGHCAGDALLDFEVQMAFQPIVDVTTRTVYAYEALVRGAEGEGAASVIAQLRPEQLYRFDQTCRVKAIATAAQLGMRESAASIRTRCAARSPAASSPLVDLSAARCSARASRRWPSTGCCGTWASPCSRATCSHGRRWVHCRASIRRSGKHWTATLDRRAATAR